MKEKYSGIDRYRNGVGYKVGDKRKEAVNEAQRCFLKERDKEIGGKKIENVKAKVGVEWVMLNVCSIGKRGRYVIGDTLKRKS